MRNPPITDAGIIVERERDCGGGTGGLRVGWDAFAGLLETLKS